MNWLKVVGVSCLCATMQAQLFAADGSAEGVKELPAPQTAVIAGGFGIAGSAESSGDHPKLFPLLHAAGATTVRSFPEWQVLQPKKGVWNFAVSDALVESAAKNRIQIMGVLAFLAPWASAAGDTRTFPIKDMQDWKNYVAGVVTRYHNHIKLWEIYNEFQGFSKNGTPKDYAAMVHDAWEVAKKIDPEAKIGLGTSSVDLSFLEEVIKLGAAGHFDWIDVHPYELMVAAMEGREPMFLQLMPNIRKMLAKTGQRQDIPVLIGEIGFVTTDKPEDELRQAECLAKSYLLCFAQGIKGVYWFEGRGPYHMGLIRDDAAWTLRPSYSALKTLAGLLGISPETTGWLNPTGQSYCFVFQGANGPVMAAWASSSKGDTLKMPAEVTLTDLLGKTVAVKAGDAIALTRMPVYIGNLPKKMVQEATANKDKPFPWTKDYGQAESVFCLMASSNVESGLTVRESGDGKTVLAIQPDGSYARRSDKNAGNEYVYFDVDDSYAGVGDSSIEVIITAKPANIGAHTICTLTYESQKGYHESSDIWNVAAKDEWQTYTFKLADANFGNNWGWNFRLRMCGSAGDLMIKQVAVKRIGAKK